jgi:hypothetical protein
VEVPPAGGGSDALQSLAQLPQWCGSLLVSTHWLPQRVGALDGHPLVQA